QETRDIFYHGYDNYMKYAFPEDELRPLTCAPLTRDRENPAHIELNDVLGNYSLTLIDSLSTLAILASSKPERSHKNTALKDFQDGVAKLVEYYGDGTAGPSGQGIRARGFDLDSKVQVFETVIRGVGGLLSAHLFAVGDLPINGYTPKLTTKKGKKFIQFGNGLQYHGQLLNLARDLAERMLPAFHTPTGLPYPRVNLRYGIPFYANSVLNTDAEHGECPRVPPAKAEITETCSAGAGSLILEFTTLSRLTGDSRFEQVAKEAFWAVWHRRSTVGLVGSGIDAETGQWVTPYTGIGAGIDSFFEYAFKSHVLLSGLPHPSNATELHSPDAFLSAWESAHSAIHRHVYRSQIYQHPHYIQADLYTGAMRAFWIDSLSAYYPGLLTFAGKLDEAIEAHLLYTALWTRYSALPERWSTATGNIEMGLRWWGGRPEFIESTWYLYRATKDPWYLHVGEMALRDIKRRCWTRCGWAGLQDVRTGELNDRMESFFLGETAKYLFLLFDEQHPLNHLDAPWVLTTEGHPLIIPSRLRHAQDHPYSVQSSVDKVSLPIHYPDATATCPIPPKHVPFTISATAARHDVFHAASLARLHLMPTLENISSPLVEFTSDHPSISISDLHSPSNYTFYPWTLPLELVPVNGMSSKMAQRTTFDLSFPNLPQNIVNIGALQRINNGILVNSMSGLRLGMIQEGSGSLVDATYRIQAVSNVPLGRDEKVFIQRDTIADFNPVDPYFTRTRDTSVVDLVVDMLPEWLPSSQLESIPTATESGEITLLNTSIPLIDIPEDLEESLNAMLDNDSEGIVTDDPSFFSSLLQRLENILADKTSDATTATSAPPLPSLRRHEFAATLPTGPGAAPLPDINDPPALEDQGLSYSTEPPESPLTWETVHIADELCDTKLSPDIVKTHHVVVIKRGGCSFSTKLQNIPAVPPSSRSLKLVIMVSFPEHERVRKVREDSTVPLIQPLLDMPQLTPAGLSRPNPLPMVMVSGGQETMEVLRRARGVGIRRRLWFLTQGVRIGNLIVL
ncbi:seven-hairpin glycosidase, partial [Rhizodiscina lignyota]